MMSQSKLQLKFWISLHCVFWRGSNLKLFLLLVEETYFLLLLFSFPVSNKEAAELLPRRWAGRACQEATMLARGDLRNKRWNKLGCCHQVMAFIIIRYLFYFVRPTSAPTQGQMTNTHAALSPDKKHSLSRSARSGCVRMWDISIC